MAPCTFFAMGRCARGEHCAYSHDQPRTGQSNDVTFPPPEHDPEPGQFARKSVACRFFASGYCKRGDDCQYDHNVAQLGEMSNLDIFQADPAFLQQPKPVCRFYASGFCRNGDSCTFEHYADGQVPLEMQLERRIDIRGRPSHALPERQQRASVDQALVNPASIQSNKIPCRFFALGHCKNGSHCPYEHVIEFDSSAEAPYAALVNRNVENVSSKYFQASDSLLTDIRYLD